MVVAIHQPNFFPWLGYFDKIARSDRFVVLDTVQAPKTGGTWQNRVKLLLGADARWVTAPLDRDFHGVRAIRDMEFRRTDWRDTLLKTLRAAYGAAPFYQDAMALLEPLIRNPDHNVARYNLAAVRGLSAALGLDPSRFTLASDLDATGQGSDLLVSLVQRCGADTYLCGDGADGYFDAPAFARAGITVVYQRFRPVPYSQLKQAEFVPGLSIVDALMHRGITEVARWMRPAVNE